MWIFDVLDLVVFFEGWFVKLSQSETFVVFCLGLLVMPCKHNSDRKREFDTLGFKESVWFCLLWLLRQVKKRGVCILNWLAFWSCEVTNLVCVVPGACSVCVGHWCHVSLKHVRQNLFRDNGQRRFMRLKTSALAGFSKPILQTKLKAGGFMWTSLFPNSSQRANEKIITKQHHDAKQRWNKQIWKMLISTQTRIWQNELNTKISRSKPEIILKKPKMENRPKQAKNPQKWNISKKWRRSNVWDVRDISRTPPGHFRDISGTSPGQLRDISGTSPGQLRDISGTNLKISEISRQKRWFFPLEGANAIFEFSAECSRLCLVYLNAFVLQIKSPNIRCIGPFFFTLAARMFARFVFRFRMKIKF